MIDMSWSLPAEEREADFTGAPRPLLATWNYLRTSLRRSWRVWSGLALLGAELGVAVAVLLPAPSQATVTLLMVHPANADGQASMQTDLSLLNTRETALRTVHKLGLPLQPEAFQGTISAESVTPQILTITVSAPDAASALARTEALTTEYLAFRGEQLRSVNSGLVDGYKARIDAVQQQLKALDQDYRTAAAQGAAGQSRASALLTQRVQLGAQVGQMQQAIEDATLSTDAAVSSTHIIDAAHVVSRSLKRTMALDVATGLLGGVALGAGIVLVRALTTDRLRRRRDVALALSAPIRYSVRSPGPSERRLAWRLRSGWAHGDLEVLVQGLVCVLLPGHAVLCPAEGTGGDAVARGHNEATRGVAVVAIGNERAAAALLVSAGHHLHDAGLTVLMVDLSRSGALAALERGRSPHPRLRGGDGAHPADPARVYRPSTGLAALARGPLAAPYGGGANVALGDEWGERWDRADVVLLLANVDPGFDAENLRTWVDQAIPLVSAGRSTPEQLETTSELLRAAGLELPFAMMTGAAQADQSLGLLSRDLPDAVTGTRP